MRVYVLVATGDDGMRIEVFRYYNDALEYASDLADSYAVTIHQRGVKG